MKIQVVSHDEADVIVPNPPDGLKAVVSIFSPPNSRMAAWVNTHGQVRTEPCLGFDEFDGEKIALTFDDATVGGTNVFIPESADIKRFIEWCDNVPFPREGSTILFHCHAGIARSTSCALVFLSSQSGKGYERQCIDEIFESRPQTWFNDLIVEHADSLLKRDGALISAVSEWKDEQRARGIFTL